MESCDYRWRECGRKAAELKVFSLFLKGDAIHHTTKVAILKCAILWLVVYAVSHATITTVSFQNLLINPKIHSYSLAIKLQLLKEKGEGSTRCKYILD